MNIIKDIKKFIINKLNKSDRNVNLTQENLKQKQYNDNIENKEKINEIIDALETVDSNITNINTNLNNKVSKSGDTLTGELIFINKNDYGAIRKARTIDGTDYTLSVGVGANKSARLELYTGQGNVGQLDVKNDGTIWNGKTSRRLLEDVTTVTQANTNLNNYNQTGIYYFAPGVVPTNIPAGSNGWLVVMIQPGGAIKQLWLRQGTANSNDFETYVRTETGGWSSWRRFVTANEVLTLTEGTGTRDTTNTNATDFECFWKKIGRICCVSVYVNPSTTTSNKILVSGLPAAKDHQDFNLAGNGNISANFRIFNDGTIRTFYLNNKSGITYKGGFTYITQS